MGSVTRRTKPCARSNSGVTVSPAGKTFSSSTFTTEYETPNGLWKPRFGMRRCSGIWPPSNPRRREYPRRDFCPLLPAPAVLPSFEPIPRPTRTLRVREPTGGCKFASVKERCSFVAGVAGLCWPRLRVPLDFFFGIALLHHFHEVPHFVDHSAHRRRILAFHHLMQPPQAEAADGLAHVIGAADKADHPFDLHGAGVFFGLFLRSHPLLSVAATFSFSLAGLPLISSTVFERVSATCAASFKPSSAAKVALITLCGLEVPMDFVSTLVMPATCITLRTGPPAITPVPSEAGLSNTCAEP